MSTPLIWIALPLIFALFLALIQKKQVLSCILGTLFAFSLALLAAFFPDNLIVELGPLSFEVNTNLNILGRVLLINPGNLPFISLMYFFAGLWIIGSGWFKLSNWFQAISFSIVAILIAALAVEPFLYAALLIELAVLLSIPLLSPYREKVSTGVLRFLIFQTLALPLILLSGWMLSGIETAPSGSSLINQATILLILGFTFWLAVFPFHTWVPMISQTSHPWIVSFILLILPNTILMFALTFIDRYTWLRAIPELYNTLRLIGTLMIVIGGVLVAFQRHLGRALGFAAIIETGFSLLAVGLSPQGGMNWFCMLILPRALAYWLWAFSLSQLKKQVDDLSLDSVSSAMHAFPFLCGGIILGQLSIAGLPLLASFPIKRMIWFSAADPDLLNALWIFIGSMGLFIFSLRTLIHFSASLSEGKPFWKINESISVIVPIAVAVIAIFILGLLPQLLFPRLLSILNAFEHFPYLQ